MTNLKVKAKAMKWDKNKHNKKLNEATTALSNIKNRSFQYFQKRKIIKKKRQKRKETFPNTVIEPNRSKIEKAKMSVN